MHGLGSVSLGRLRDRYFRMDEDIPVNGVQQAAAKPSSGGFFLLLDDDVSRRLFRGHPPDARCGVRASVLPKYTAPPPSCCAGASHRATVSLTRIALVRHPARQITAPRAAASRCYATWRPRYYYLLHSTLQTNTRVAEEQECSDDKRTEKEKKRMNAKPAYTTPG